MLTPEEQAWLETHPVIRVHNEMDWAPFNFNVEGIPQGFSIEYIKLVAEKTGLGIEFISGPSWDEFIDLIKKDGLDVMLNIARSPERKKFLTFSKPYIKMIQALYTRQGFPPVESIEDLAGRRFAVPKGFYIQEILAKYPQVKIVEVKDTSAAIQAVSTGKADALFDLMPVVDHIKGQLQITNLKVGGDLNIFESRPIPLHIAVTKDKEVLAGIIKKGMDLVSDEEVRSLKTKWLGGSPHIPEKDLALTVQEKEWIAAHPVIQVYNETDYPPFDYYENGIPKGFSIEYMNLLASKAELKIDYVTGPEWNDALDMIRNKKLDVMLNIIQTQSRQEYILFTEPYARNPNVIVSSAKSPFYSMAELTGATVAVVPGYFHEEILDISFPQIKLLRAENMAECLKAVAFGNADATVGELAVLKYLIAQNMLTGLQVSGEIKIGSADIANMRIGVRKDWPPLVGILEKAIAAISPTEMATLKANWLDISLQGDEFRLTPQEELWLKAHPELRLGIDPDWPPFQYLDETGKHAGIAADYVRLLEKRLGISMVLQTHLKTWSQVMEKARAGDVDILAAVGKTDEREKFLEFTAPYLKLPLVVITRKDGPAVHSLDALKGKSIVVQKDTAQWRYISQALPGQKLIAAENMAEALKAVSEGRVDATIENLAAINYLERKLGIDNIKVASVTPLNIGISFAVRKDMAVLAGILERALASIHTEEQALIQDKWVNVQVEHRTDWGYVWKVAVAVAGIALIIFVFIFRSNQKLAREASLRKVQEKRFRALIEGAPDAMVIVDERGLIQRINLQAEKVFGYAREELVGQAIEALVPEETRERHPQLRQGYLDNPSARRGEKTFALRAQAKDGRIFPVDVNLSPLETEEGTLVVASVRDVTERKKAESRLRLTQYAMDKAVHAILWLSLDDSHFLYANDAAIEQLGYTREEFLDMGAMDVDITLTPVRWGEFVELLGEKDFLTLESRQRRKDGVIRDVMVTNYLSEYEDSAIIVAFVEDITDHKLAEKARMESEKRFRSYFESGQVGMSITSPEKGWLETNSQIHKMLGYSLEELQQTDWAQLTHPDDLQADLDLHAKMVAGEIDQYAMDKRFIKKNGEVLYVNLTVAAGRDENGAIEYTLASYLDITERKQAETEIKNSQTRLAQIIDSLPDPTFVIDNEGVVTAWNHAMADITGIPAKDMIGKGDYEYALPFYGERRPILINLVTEWDDSLKEKYLSVSQKEDGVLVSESYHPDLKNGIYLAGIAKVLYDIDGQPAGAIESIRDITETHAFQEALKESEARVKTILDSVNTGIIVINPENRTIVDVNPLAAAMIELAPEDIIGKVCHKFICPREKQDCPILDHGQAVENAERILLTAEGREIPILKTVVPVELDGKARLLESFVDISERKAAEEELQRNLDELERFNKLTINREERMISLKTEINQVLTQLGKPEKYKIVE